MPTKFEQRNSAAGKMTGSELARKAGSGQMSAKEIADQVMKANMNKSAKPSSSTKPNATKTSGSNVKPSTTKPTATKSMKTQNIPEVTVSVKKKVVAPVTPVMKEKGAPVTSNYVVRLPGGEYKELTYNEYQTYKGPGNKQILKPSVYESNKGRITTLKKPDPAKN